MRIKAKFLNFEHASVNLFLSGNRLEFAITFVLKFRKTRHYGALRAPSRLAPAPQVTNPTGQAFVCQNYHIIYMINIKVTSLLAFCNVVD